VWDWEHFCVRRNDHLTSVLPFPISIELPCDIPEARSNLTAQEERSALFAELGIEATFLGRVDYTKGILERFQAFKSFLERYRSYQGKFTFIQIGAFPTICWAQRRAAPRRGPHMKNHLLLFQVAPDRHS
jgi:trehalose-6-phosphate synthase